MDLPSLVDRLRADAQAANERRLLALTGDRETGIDAAYTAIEAAEADETAVSLVTTREGFRYHRLHPDSANELLGTTREMSSSIATRRSRRTRSDRSPVRSTGAGYS
jgi:hypothetical protein